MTDTSWTPELLSTHAASLRGLARQLIGCPYAAEDAVQETWIRAMRSSPRSVGRMRAWLNTVLHRVVLSQQRGESCRAFHERHAATDGQVDSPLDLLERSEALHSRMLTIRMQVPESVRPNRETVYRIRLRSRFGSPPIQPIMAGALDDVALLQQQNVRGRF